MGKNLKGKECGNGICQRKDGQYYARFVSKSGKRKEDYFPTLPEARNCMLLADVKPMHCKMVLNKMEDKYAGSTIRQAYNTHLYKLCDEAEIKRFCMHALRHTYATRAIERVMQPKVLQKLLGHASVKTTMDRYVHITDDSLSKGVRQFESYQTA